MANVVRIHVNGFTYTHASATTLADAAVGSLWEKIGRHQLVNPLAPLTIDVKAEGSVTTLMVFPQLVWAFSMWVAPEPTSTTSGGSGVGITIGL